MTNAQKAEAKREPLVVEWKGESYTVEVAEMTIDALEAVESEKWATASRLLLGDEQWARFKASNVTVAELAEFVQAINEAVTSSGKSSG